MRFQFLIFLIISLVVLGVVRDLLAKESNARHHLTIVYTNDVQGEIEPCG